MPTAHEVATELRKLADSLDHSPDAQIKVPTLIVSHYGEHAKEEFLALCRLLPRPLKKSVTDYSESPDLHITYYSDALTILATIPQSVTCTLVEPARPAKYRCEPILSEAEDAELEVL